jgi:hypothetical protein
MIPCVTYSAYVRDTQENYNRIHIIIGAKTNYIAWLYALFF